MVTLSTPEPLKLNAVAKPTPASLAETGISAKPELPVSKVIVTVLYELSPIDSVISVTALPVYFIYHEPEY
jgi:hypothetical protein